MEKVATKPCNYRFKNNKKECLRNFSDPLAKMPMPDLFKTFI